MEEADKGCPMIRMDVCVCVCVCVCVLAVRTPDQLIVVMLLEYQLPSHVSSAPQLITPSDY